MQLTHHFTVPVPVEEAWRTFNDLERIAPCFPGAALTSYDGDTFEGICKVKLGPVSLQYSGTGRFLERDEAAHRAVIEAKGNDKRGNGTASAVISTSLSSADGDVTAVAVTTDLTITGRPAQFGRGVMQDVSDRLLAQFASCLEERLAGPAVIADHAEAPAAVDPTPASVTEPTPSSQADAEPATTNDSSPVSALDLGGAIVPVVLRRYAPALLTVVAALAALGALKRLVRRR